jgi:VanZ family protein
VSNIRDRSFFKTAIKLPSVLIAGGIWLLSSQSILPKPKGILGFDKVQHLIAYAVLAAAVGLWFSQEQWKGFPLRIALLTASAASCYGIIDEIHQYFVPGRDCNVWDWFADTLGAAFGAAAMMFIARKVKF